MGCKHEHLRTVGNRLFCKDCGEELPLEFLTKEKAADEQKQAENPPAEEKKTKAPARKTAAKKTK